MMRRLLIHPGFHKTGTSSAQHLLWHNRPVLKAHVAIFQLRHLAEPARIAMAVSRTGDTLRLADMAEALEAVFADLPRRPTRHVLLTCEGLSGHLPGWPGVNDYGAAPAILAYLAGWLSDRFPAHRPEILLTTRGAQAWLGSAWRHHLLGQRLTQDWPDFARRLGPAADLSAAARAIAEAVAPIPVRTRDLGKIAGLPLGPGQALLDPLGLPEEVLARLEPVGHGNPGPSPELAAEFLALNRSGLDDSSLAAKKAELARAAGVGGWVRAR